MRLVEFVVAAEFVAIAGVAVIAVSVAVWAAVVIVGVVNELVVLAALVIDLEFDWTVLQSGLWLCWPRLTYFEPDTLHTTAGLASSFPWQLASPEQCKENTSNYRPV